jgi:hypothetical protein
MNSGRQEQRKKQIKRSIYSQCSELDCHTGLVEIHVKVHLMQTMKAYRGSRGKASLSPNMSTSLRLANLWHKERFLWHTAFNAIPIFLFPLPDQRPYLVKNMCVCVCVCVCIYIYVHTHIPEYAETVHEIPLLPNNSASETFFTQIAKC